MDLWELVIITFRRWKITLPVAIVAFGLAWMASSSVPPEYEAEAAVGLVGAQFTVDEATEELSLNENPIIVANEGRTALAFTERAVTSANQKTAALEAGYTDSYSVTLDRFSPILQVEVAAETPALAVDTANYLVQVINDDIIDRQEASGVEEEGLQLDPQTLYVDQEASVDVTPQTRMRVILGVIALLVVVGVAVLADAWFVLRERRRSTAVATRDEQGDEEWDDSRDLVESAVRVEEVAPNGDASTPEYEEWGRR